MNLLIAFIKIEQSTPHYLEISQEARHETGDHVCAIGNPLGFEGVLTDGLISKVDTEMNGRHFIMISASIEPGNSGGPLLNDHAQLIGINTSGIGSATVMNFAVPIISMWKKYSEIRNKIDYLFDNYFCAVCGNTSYGASYCDHCGVPIKAHDKKQNDEYAITCKKCSAVSDGEIDYCPSCSAKI